MIKEVLAYYPSMFYSKVRKIPPQKIKDIRYPSAINQKFAERYNRQGMKECSYSSAFDIRI